jgi:peptide/nickel transport system substrate-binding protein
MHVLYQTTINSLRQKEQALFKDGWQKIGIEMELKAVDSGVFFSTDPGNPDTNWHFYADVETSSVPYDSPFSLRYMKQFYSGVPVRDWAQKANNWTAQNFTKWSSLEFNQLSEQASKETNPVRAGEIFVRMNNLVVNSHSRIALSIGSSSMPAPLPCGVLIQVPSMADSPGTSRIGFAPRVRDSFCER